MTDYVRDTGSTGKMMIRDTGSVVELWVYAGPLTSTGHLPWNYTANGVTSAWNYFNYYNSGNWMKVHSFTVSTTQVVTFRIGDSNTLGFAGPTSLSATISRASAPDAPTITKLTVLSSTSIRVQFTDGDANGSAIGMRQIGYGVGSNAPQTIVSSDRDTNITGLLPGRKYYFWARTHNSLGWSPWSVRKEAVTWSVPGAPSTPKLSNIKQASMDVTFTVPNTGGTPILERQISWGTTSAATGHLVSSDGSTTMTNLAAGQKIWVKARARNSVGWGAWSPIASATLVAGAFVYHIYDYFRPPNSDIIYPRAAWFRAVPYVNVNGVWKVATPYVRILGVWKGTG